MAKNDAILLDGILENRALTESLGKGEMFELFAFEQILKGYDLDRGEIDSGWVDGRDDGGIDGFYTFVNGILVDDAANFPWPRKSVTIDVVIINCKHRDSFQQNPLNTLFPTLEELLDFGKSPEDFDGIYSDAVIKSRQKTVQAFRSTAEALPKLAFKLVYASRGDTVEPNIEARGQQLKRIVSDYFSDAQVSLEYLGAAELIALHRKNQFVLSLPYSEQLIGEQGSYVMLVGLADYANFAKDERGNLRRYLFDSNVRDFLGGNRVNQDILASLEVAGSPDFWWLNNGITILATSAMPLGKTDIGKAIQLHDVQIVNGLQTTQSIHNFFAAGGVEPKNGRCVLVKVIVSDESEVRDRIIRATNNQTSVELASLTATDKIQRDIEEVLEQHSWFYERRKNYYKNIGKPVERFVQPLYLAVSVVALIRKAPQIAGRLKMRTLQKQENYEEVFSTKLPILVWPKLAEVMKLVDRGIAGNLPHTRTKSRMVAGWRGATALCVVAEVSGTFDYSIDNLISLDVSKISEQRVGEIFSFLTTEAGQILNTNKNGGLRARTEISCEKFATNNGIIGVNVVGRWSLPGSLRIQKAKALTPNAKPLPNKPAAEKTIPKPQLSSENLERIANSLPAQPWKPGMQHIVAAQLGLPLSNIRQGIKTLIDAGRIFHQRNGVVYNKDGLILAIDLQRANPKFAVGDIYDFAFDDRTPPG